MPGRLHGKVALITGTGGGQGRAAALLFAAEGAIVVGGDLKSDSSQETVELVRAAGGAITSVHPGDFAERAEVEAWISSAVAERGRIDVLYNNASAPRFRSIADMSVEDWQSTIRNELDLIFHVTQAAWPYLIAAGGGSIVASHGRRRNRIIGRRATRGRRRPPGPRPSSAAFGGVRVAIPPLEPG